MNSRLLIAMEHLVREFEALNPNAARKVSLALSQLKEASSVEEYQQIGIIVRDAWIEFAQCVFRLTMIPDDEPVPKAADAKGMIKYALRYYTPDHEYLLTLARNSFDLSNRVQHGMNVKSETASQLLCGAILCMTLINNVVTRSALYVQRPYYKCPNCGSLKLESKTEGMMDYNGPLPIKILRCTECEWYYIGDLGGMSGVGAHEL